MENLGGFKMDISMRRVWPRLSTSDTIVCAHTNVFNCLCDMLGLWAAPRPGLCCLQVARTSRSRLKP